MATRRTFYEIRGRGNDKFATELDRIGDRGQRAFDRITNASKPANRGLLALNDASRAGQDVMRGYAARLGPAGAGLTALGSGGLAAAAGVGAATVALRAGMQRARQAVGTLDEIGKSADAIGVTTDSLQELRFAGERMGVSVGNIDKGLEAFVKRLGEMRQGAGRLNTLLNKTDPAFKQMLLNASSTDEALDLLLQRLAGTSNQADRLALSAAAFGRGPGVNFARIVRDGADEVDRLRRQARDLGVVIDESLIRNAEATADKFTNLQRIIDANLNTAFVSLAPLVVKVSEALATGARNARSFADAANILFDNAGGATTLGIEEAIDRVDDKLKRARESVAEAEAIARGDGPLGQVGAFLDSLPLGISNTDEARELVRKLERERAALVALRAARRDQPRDPFSRTPPPGADGGNPPERSPTKAPSPTAPRAGDGLTGAEIAARSRDLVARTKAFDEREAAATQGVLDRAFAGADFLAERQAERRRVQANARREVEGVTRSLAQRTEVLRAAARGETDLAEALRLRNGLSVEGRRLFDQQRGRIVEAIRANRQLTEDLARQREVIDSTSAAFGDFASGLISRTQSMGGALRGLAEDLLNVAAKVAIVDPFKKGIEGILTNGGIGGGIADFFGFGGGSGGAATGPPVKLFQSARGNFFTRPSLTTVSERGHPEAVLPLRRNARGDLGVQASTAPPAPTVVQIIDQRGGGERIQTRRQRQPDGREMVVAVVRDAMARGELDGAAAGRFGLQPQGVSR